MESLELRDAVLCQRTGSRQVSPQPRAGWEERVRQTWESRDEQAQQELGAGAPARALVQVKELRLFLGGRWGIGDNVIIDHIVVVGLSMR